MTETQTLLAELKQELFVEANGEGSMTQSAIARLIGITKQSMNQLLKSIASGRTLSEPLKQFSDMDLTASVKIPDYVVGAIFIDNLKTGIVLMPKQDAKTKA